MASITTSYTVFLSLRNVKSHVSPAQQHSGINRINLFYSKTSNPFICAVKLGICSLGSDLGVVINAVSVALE